MVEIQQRIDLDEHVLRLALPEDDEPGPVVYRAFDGTWWAGRYIGQISFAGRQLVIQPRLGVQTVARWLPEARNLRTVAAAATHEQSEAFLAWLLAAVWCRRVDDAARHGLPSIKRDDTHVGIYARGRLDAQQTEQRRGRGQPYIATRTRRRDVNNDVSRTLVLAERVLARYLDPIEWRTPRVREVIPQLRAAVGPQPRLPNRRALDRVRYTPITLPFKRAADFSYRVARRRGFVSAGVEGKFDALLIDVAELWELFVLNSARRVFGHSRIEHGTHGRAGVHLLSSATVERRLGRLKPDVIVRGPGEAPRAIIDVKYKRLEPSKERPSGVDRGDLYQLMTYLSRYEQAEGMLAYPYDPHRPDQAQPEQGSPWIARSGQRVRFVRLPVDPEACERRLTELFG